MPPNPNEEKYANSGMGDALQIIYESSSKSEKNTNETAADPIDTQTSAAISALNATACGLVALNKDRKIVYANKPVPHAVY